MDVSWLSRTVEVFCEVKLSEREFGPAEADERHKHKLATRYGPVLRDQVDAGLLRSRRSSRTTRSCAICGSRAEQGTSGIASFSFCLRLTRS